VQRDDDREEFDAVVHHQADGVAGADAAIAEDAREPICQRVELGPRDRAPKRSAFSSTRRPIESTVSSGRGAKDLLTRKIALTSRSVLNTSAIDI
jgi:hypothetical protein